MYKKPTIRELTPQERAFITGFQLGNGRQLSARQIAEMNGTSVRSAHNLLNKGSRVVPIYSDRGKWQKVK